MKRYSAIVLVCLVAEFIPSYASDRMVDDLPVQYRCVDYAGGTTGGERIDYMKSCLREQGAPTTSRRADHISDVIQLVEIRDALDLQLREAEANDSVVAIEGGGAPWCPVFLRDLLNMHDVQVLPMQSPPPMELGLDPGRAVYVNGTKVLFGSVPLRWQGKALRIFARGDCAGGSPREQKHCSSAVHWFSVYEAAPPFWSLRDRRSCTTQIYSRGAFENRRDQAHPQQIHR